MRPMRPWMIYSMLPLVVVAAGCSQPPTEQVTATEHALEEARGAGAPKYLPEDFAKVESALANAKQEIAEQEAKFSLTRDYEQAQQLLGAAQAEAARLVAETGEKKEEAKAAAARAHQAAQASVKEAQQLVAMAPAGKDRAALEAIKADVDALAASLPDIQRAMEVEDYQAAEAKAHAVQDKSQAVSMEVQHALAKVQKAHRPKKK